MLSTRYTNKLEKAWLHSVVLMKICNKSLDVLQDVTYVLLPDGTVQYYDKDRFQRLDNIVPAVYNTFDGQLKRRGTAYRPVEHQTGVANRSPDLPPPVRELGHKQHSQENV